MTDPLVEVGDGGTPIDENEVHGLLPTWVRTRRDLNEAEATNIDAANRAVGSVDLEKATDDLWLRRLHRSMFCDVWERAGQYRLTERNIGIDPIDIAPAVRTLVRDCRTWFEFEPGRIPVARFHHRMVAIHPFPNGNGRHARVATDHLCVAAGMSRPSWGANTNVDLVDLRADYLAALRNADRDGEDLDRLVSFMWS